MLKPLLGSRKKKFQKIFCKKKQSSARNLLQLKITRRSRSLNTLKSASYKTNAGVLFCVLDLLICHHQFFKMWNDFNYDVLKNIIQHNGCSSKENTIESFCLRAAEICVPSLLNYNAIRSQTHFRSSWFYPLFIPQTMVCSMSYSKH